MSQALNITDTSYAGEAASSMLLRPVATADTVAKGCINIQETKKEFHFPRLEVSNFLQKDSPTPTSKGSALVDGNRIYLETFQIYLEFDPQQFSQHWYANELNNQIIDRSLPQTVETALMFQLMAQNNLKIDSMIWRADKNYDPTSPTYVTPASRGADSNDSDLYYFNGLIKQALLDPTTITVPGAFTITATNSVTALTNTYNLIPKGLLNKFGAYGTKFLVSYRTMQLIEQNYNLVTPYKNGQFSEAGSRQFLGYEIVAIAGFPDNTIYACMASPNYNATNTFLVVNSKDDTSNVKIAPVQNFSDIWGLRAKMKMNVGLGFGDQGVLFTNITA